MPIEGILHNRGERLERDARTALVGTIGADDAEIPVVDEHRVVDGIQRGDPFAICLLDLAVRRIEFGLEIVLWSAQDLASFEVMLPDGWNNPVWKHVTPEHAREAGCQCGLDKSQALPSSGVTSAMASVAGIRSSSPMSL